MSEATTEQRAQEYINQLGRELGSVFSHVLNDFYVTILEWRIFSEWFRSGTQRIDLLNSVSGTTALIIQNALRERAVVRICRLTDPFHQGKGKKNASLDALLELSESKPRALEELIEIAKEKSKNARFLRSKRLVHSDFAHATNQEMIEGVSYIEIDESLRAIGAVIRSFGESHLDTHFSFSIISPFGSDELAFLNALSEGERALAEKRASAKELMDEGRYHEAQEKLNKPEWLERRKFENFLDNQTSNSSTNRALS